MCCVGRVLGAEFAYPDLPLRDRPAAQAARTQVFKHISCVFSTHNHLNDDCSIMRWLQICEIRPASVRYSRAICVRTAVHTTILDIDCNRYRQLPVVHSLNPRAVCAMCIYTHAQLCISISLSGPCLGDTRAKLLQSFYGTSVATQRSSQRRR
jgi:hypothetical protein